MKRLLISAALAGLPALTAQEASPTAVFTAAQAEAGRATYQIWCTKCHTDKLTGQPARPGIYQEVPPLAGAVFLTKWGARTPQNLYERVRAVESLLNEEKNLSLVAYILQFNGAQPGAQAVTATTGGKIRSIAPGLVAPGSARPQD